jgi:uncharacterized membrane-anchored protein YjiN (DUF445 family)
MRRRATGLLVVMTVVWIVARSAEEGGAAWIGYVRATAEAAMIGGLADWFAVTAMFRHPLGIPIPHTAIVPNRKDQIGRSLGEFLQRNFLSGPVVADRLTASRPGARLAEWLARPGSAAIVARHAADAIVAVTGALDDEEIQTAVEDLVVTRLRVAPIAPLAGRVLGAVTEGGRHHELLDSLLRGFDRYLVEEQDILRGRFARESPWWVPEAIDDRIFEKLHGGLRGFIAEVVADPRHEVRQHLDARLAELVVRLQEDPDLIARGESLKEELLAHHALRDWTSSLWADAKRAIAEQAADPTSPLRQRLESAVGAVGRRLAEDPALQARVDSGLARFAAYVLDEYADDLAEIIRQTVERWDAVVVTDQLEVLLGRDLQFIRINGTVVGGLVGLLLYSVSQAFG